MLYVAFFSVKFSAIEIYNEAIRDLLSSDGASLRLRDDPEVNFYGSYQKGTLVEKATEETLRDWNHLKDLLSVCEGIVEIYRLKHKETASNSSSLSIFWQVPQYMMIGASEVFMYVGQLEFFNSQAPTGLKSFASALCMASISLGNYVSSLLVSIVMSISTRDDLPGWIPGNLNKGHLDRFYFLLAGLTAADFVVYLVCAKWYKYIKSEASFSESTSEEEV